MTTDLTLESLAIIPPMPVDANDQWDMLWQALDTLKTDNMLLRMELAFYQSQDSREKWAGEYVEDAVAQVYGFPKVAFYGTHPVGTKPKYKQINEARFLLYTILHHIIGVPVPDLTKYYHSFVNNHIVRWRRIFIVTHTANPLTDDKDKELYTLYAAKYRQVYAAMRAAMVEDGVWENSYNDDAVNLLP